MPKRLKVWVKGNDEVYLPDEIGEIDYVNTRIIEGCLIIKYKNGDAHFYPLTELTCIIFEGEDEE